MVSVSQNILVMKLTLSFISSIEDSWPVICEKAKEDLLKLSIIVQPKDKAICFVFAWACRHFPHQLSTSAEVILKSY